MDLLRRLDDRLEGRSPRLMNHHRYLKTAVMVPMVRRTVDGNDRWHLLFERRADHLDHQPGDACFPGGRMEEHDDSPRHTALRETCEEFGVEPGDLEVLGGLDYLATPWRMMIFPYVGVLRSSVEIRPEPGEVQRVFEVPLTTALEAEPAAHQVDLLPRPSEDFPYEKIPGGRDYAWSAGVLPELFYEFDGEVVWGLTGRILNHFLRVVRGEGFDGDARQDTTPPQ